MKYANTLTKGKNSSNKSLQIENKFNIFLHKTFKKKGTFEYMCANLREISQGPTGLPQLYKQEKLASQK